jgi:hypothetical protein
MSGKETEEVGSLKFLVNFIRGACVFIDWKFLTLSRDLEFEEVRKKLGLAVIVLPGTFSVKFLETLLLRSVQYYSMMAHKLFWKDCPLYYILISFSSFK